MDNRNTMETYVRTGNTTCRAMRFNPSALAGSIPEFVGKKNCKSAAPWFVTTGLDERVSLQPGDWIVEEPDGSGHYPVKDAVFRSAWSALDNIFGEPEEEDCITEGPGPDPHAKEEGVVIPDCSDKFMRDYGPAHKDKTLHNSGSSPARKNVEDMVTFGDPDAWKLICKASSEREGWMKSTKAMEVPGIGCLVQVTTQQRNPDGSYSTSEAVAFAPGVRIRSAQDFISNAIVRELSPIKA